MQRLPFIEPLLPGRHWKAFRMPTSKQMARGVISPITGRDTMKETIICLTHIWLAVTLRSLYPVRLPCRGGRWPCYYRMGSPAPWPLRFGLARSYNKFERWHCTIPAEALRGGRALIVQKTQDCRWSVGPKLGGLETLGTIARPSHSYLKVAARCTCSTRETFFESHEY